MVYRAYSRASGIRSQMQLSLSLAFTVTYCDHRSSSPWTAVGKLYGPSKLYRLVLDKPFIKSLKFEKNNNSVKPLPGTSCIAILQSRQSQRLQRVAPCSRLCRSLRRPTVAPRVLMCNVQCPAVTAVSISTVSKPEPCLNLSAPNAPPWSSSQFRSS